MTRPSLRDRLKPLELVGFAALLGVFAGVVCIVGTRDPRLALIFTGIGFIVGLLVLAMLALAAGAPEGTEDGPVLQRPHRKDRPPK